NSRMINRKVNPETIQNIYDVVNTEELLVEAHHNAFLRELLRRLDMQRSMSEVAEFHKKFKVSMTGTEIPGADRLLKQVCRLWSSALVGALIRDINDEFHPDVVAAITLWIAVGGDFDLYGSGNPVDFYRRAQELHDKVLGVLKTIPVVWEAETVMAEAFT